jgi:hypothetical protein
VVWDTCGCLQTRAPKRDPLPLFGAASVGRFGARFCKTKLDGPRLFHQLSYTRAGTSSSRLPQPKRRRSPSASRSRPRAPREGKRARDAKKKATRKVEPRPTAPRDASRKVDSKSKPSTGSTMTRGKEDGRHFVDSSGSQLCWPWNHKPNGCADTCPQRRAHACEWCLSTQHRAIACQKKPAGWVP